ncbi:hypothetical protein ACFQZJ_00035 [Maribacter chungangensis]|uniref:PcfK-like protein n=1 Tax=Maribacter chungangensis TaxID=1069117 RepID=A0ABW3AY42_9FLAO
MKTKEQELVIKYKKLLESNPPTQIFAEKCAEIAKEYHTQQLAIDVVVSSVFTIHSTENDEIIKVVRTPEQAQKEVKEFKDGHAYADFYYQKQDLK